MRSPYYEPMRRIVNRFFREQEAALTAQIKIDGQFFDTNKWAQRFLEMIIGGIDRILRDGLLAGMLRLGKEPIDTSGRDVEYQVIARQVARSELINEETEAQVTAMLVQMEQENATGEEMRRALRRLFSQYRAYRTDRIVNTVIVGAWEAGQLRAWQEAGIDKKVWISTRDSRVREDHDTRLHPELAEAIALDAPFIVGGAALLHPGDPEGPAGQVINCRCTMAPIIED